MRSNTPIGTRTRKAITGDAETHKKLKPQCRDSMYDHIPSSSGQRTKKVDAQPASIRMFPLAQFDMNRELSATQSLQIYSDNMIRGISGSSISRMAQSHIPVLCIFGLKH